MKYLVKKNIDEWSKYPFCDQTQKEINILINDETKLYDAFYKNLEFGTGGMRGLMGVGTNRINKYTIGKNTQGISNYLNKNIDGKKSAVIAYDCRHNSMELARTVAEVFSANDIKVFLFSNLRPTPELSYAVRKLNCSCGIVLTASHNPPEYNGFKVYWQDGGQIVPPVDDLLINELEVFVGDGAGIAKNLKLRGLPTTLFIDKDGYEFARIVGSIDFNSDEFLNWLNELN